MTLQAMVNTYGTALIVAYGVCIKVEGVGWQMAEAIGTSLGTFTGQNVGANHLDRVKQGVRYTQMMVLGWSVFVMFLMFFFGKYLTYLFVDPSEQDVVNVSVTYFRTVFWAYPFLGSIFLYRNTLQGMGYGLVPMLGGVFELVARTGIVVLIAGHTSFAGVCLEGAIIVLACVIYSLFASAPPSVSTGASAITQVWTYVGEIVFNMLVLVGTVKLSDQVVSKMLGI